MLAFQAVYGRRTDEWSNASGSVTSIDPDEERNAPPQPSLVYFPQNEIELKPDEEWIHHAPNLYKRYSHLSKPTELHYDHIAALNFSVENNVALEDFIPQIKHEPTHLPPKAWLQHTANPSQARRESRLSLSSLPDNPKHLLLSNDAKAPEPDIFVKAAKELTCPTEDGLRVVARRKQRAGHSAPNLNHFRDFWAKLELLSQYWDTSMDNYFERAEPPPPPTQSKPSGLKRLSIFSTKETPTNNNNSSDKKPSTKRYKGLRKSNGSRMPDYYRSDTVRAMVRAVATMFECQSRNPKKTPYLEIRQLLIPVTQSAVVHRIPAEKNMARRGVGEGPVLSIQARGEISFVKDQQACVLDMAREMAGLLLMAQERTREGKPKEIPGAGKWYVTTPRWGGGPGGEFGEAEGNREQQGGTGFHSEHSASSSSSSSTSSRPSTPPKFYSSLPGTRKPTEEEIWRQLKPGDGLWEPQTTYLAVGKDRTSQWDTVFMVSSLFHHISILRLDVHPTYLTYVKTGHPIPPKARPKDEPTWFIPCLKRTPWYDLLNPEDRGEAFRALWAVFSYQMRSSHTHPSPVTANGPPRQGSEGSTLQSPRPDHRGSLSFLSTRRRSGGFGSGSEAPPRSHSVAF